VSSSNSKTTPAKIIRSTSEFAAHVGLARTTVSRVLNGQPGLKKKTIDRVRRAIEETGFVPNAYALHLKGKRPATVGVCMQNIAFPPLVQKLASLHRKLRERDVTTFIEIVEGGDSAGIIRHFLSLRVDAVVFMGYFDEERVAQHLRGLSTNGTPSLVIDHFGIKGANTIYLDRARGMAALTNHLLDHGHRRFGLLGYSETFRSTFERERGIRGALAARGFSFEESTMNLDHLHERGRDFEYGRALAHSFVENKSGRLPTAFIALNDEIAIGAMHGLKERGLGVPGDVSVAGFNNQDICLMTAPSLTSVDQRVDATIDVAVDYLLGHIGQPLRQRTSVRMIEPLLVVRESTGPARG
jgi:DNA-binding LacI/PurR family transcriptional regulator